MDGIYVIGICAAIAAVYLASKYIIEKYYKKIYNSTRYNPASIFLQIVGFLFVFTPFLIGCINQEYVVVQLIVPIRLLLLAILLINNLKVKNPLSLVLVTFAQIVYGALFVVRLFIWVFFMAWSMIQTALYGNGPSIEYSPFVIAGIESEKLYFKKTKFNYTPTPYCGGTLTNVTKYSEDIDKSRTNAEISQIESELKDIEDQKNMAMIYGYDVTEYEQMEKKLKDELDDLRK